MAAEQQSADGDAPQSSYRLWAADQRRIAAERDGLAVPTIGRHCDACGVVEPLRLLHPVRRIHQIFLRGRGGRVSQAKARRRKRPMARTSAAPIAIETARITMPTAYPPVSCNAQPTA